jgi:mycothiol system anti-sigma-R factor
MPDCNETLREIYEYLDGELTNDEKAKLRHHLEECQPCFEAFDFEAELREVIRKRCTESVPDSLRDKVRQALEQADAEPSPS